MVRVLKPCPRCRATVCHCGYVAEQKRRRLEEQRRRRPYDHGERTLHAAIIASWVERNGWWCPGAPDLEHKPHAVKPGQLDVDDVVPVSRGGGRRDVENKRILCRTMNRGRRA